MRQKGNTQILPAEKLRYSIMKEENETKKVRWRQRLSNIP